MRVLVTGSNGLLGRKVVAGLRMKGIDVIGWTRQDGDLTDKGLVNKLERLSFDQVIHLAGVIHGNFEENVEMMKNIIAVAKKKKVNRMIFVSSNAVNYRFDNYARSKREAEKMLIDSGLNYVVIRPTLFSDPESKEEKRLGWVGRLIKIVPGIRDCFRPIKVDELVKIIEGTVLSKEQGVLTVRGRWLGDII